MNRTQWKINGQTWTLTVSPLFNPSEPYLTSEKNTIFLDKSKRLRKFDWEVDNYDARYCGARPTFHAEPRWVLRRACQILCKVYNEMYNTNYIPEKNLANYEYETV